MKLHSACLLLGLASLLPSLSPAAQSTGSPFYGDAPDRHHPWSIHDQNRPQPKRVEPGTFSSATQPGTPPSDAIILFDGTAASLEKWEADTKADAPRAPSKWIVKDGAMECVPKSGYVRTKEQFGDCQLHVEWAAPKNVQGDSQGRGNSGVFFMGLYELQVLDSYNNPTYVNGQAGSIYKQHPPLVNASRPPGEWQTYEAIFIAPRFAADGTLLSPARLTVLHNGVLVQHDAIVRGTTVWRGEPKYIPHAAKLPLMLQDHRNPIAFRNIWIRELTLPTNP